MLLKPQLKSSQMSEQNDAFKLFETLHDVAQTEIFANDVGISGLDEIYKEQKNRDVVASGGDEKMTLIRDNGVFGQNGVITRSAEN